MTRIPLHFAIFPIVLSAMFTLSSGALASEPPPAAGTSTAATGEIGTRNVHMQLAAGARLIPATMWGFIPMPPSVALAVDVSRFRVRADFSYHPLSEASLGTLGAGGWFSPVGRNASDTAGFQLKLPLMAEVGFLIGSPEAGDGYSDDIGWILIGPSVGADFIWWTTGRAGFLISLKGAVHYRVDVSSDYADEPYSYTDDQKASADVALLFGVAF